MKPRAGPPVADDIPPVHVLEAAQTRDRQETEDLLAGFDRPGRGPRKPASERERDFVDYYAKKKGGPDSGRASGPVVVVGPRAEEIATVVKPRRIRGSMPGWVAWAGPGLVMLSLGGVVAYLALGNDARSSAGPRTGPSAATTITAATTSIPASRDLVPPPAPPDPTTTTTTPITVTEPPPAEPSQRAAGRRDPRGVSNTASASSAASAAAAATGNAATTTATSADRKPLPREDFIRDL